MFCTPTYFERTVDARVCLLCAGVIQQFPELTPGKTAVGKIMVFQLFKEFSFFFSQEHKITPSFLKIHFDITSKLCLHPQSGLLSSSCKIIIYNFYPTLQLPLERCAIFRFFYNPQRCAESNSKRCKVNPCSFAHCHWHPAAEPQPRLHTRVTGV